MALHCPVCTSVQRNRRKLKDHIRDEHSGALRPDGSLKPEFEQAITGADGRLAKPEGGAVRAVEAERGQTCAAVAEAEGGEEAEEEWVPDGEDAADEAGPGGEVPSEETGQGDEEAPVAQDQGGDGAAAPADEARVAAMAAGPPAADPPASGKGSGRGPRVCDLCGKTCGSPQGLAVHKWSKHNVGGVGRVGRPRKAVVTAGNPAQLREEATLARREAERLTKEAEGFRERARRLEMAANLIENGVTKL